MDQFSKTFDPRSAQVAVFSHLIHFAVFDHINDRGPPCLGVPFLCQERSDSILFDEDLYGVCAVKICVDKRLSAFASEALKKCTRGRIIWGFPFSERPRLRVGHPALKQFDYKTITAADTTVVHTPPSPTTSDVAMLKVSLGFESVHVSYMLEASFSA